MPPKKPKAALILMEKVVPKRKDKKSKRKNNQSFAKFLYRLLRSIVPDSNISISQKCMRIMDNFVTDMLERLALEAGRLVIHSKRSTMTSREIHTAVKLLIPGQLADHANIEGMKALDLYQKSRDRDAEGG